MYLNIKDIITNAMDGLDRARERLVELGEFKKDALTDDEVLMEDMTNAELDLDELGWRIEFALILAVYAGYENAKRDYEFDCDNAEWRNKFIEIASQVDIYLDDDRIDSEWAYNTASEIVKNMFEKGE